VDFNNLERVEDKKVDEFFNVDMESGELWTTALEEQSASQGTDSVYYSKDSSPVVSDGDKTIVIQPKNQTEKTQQDKSSSSSAAKILDITTVVSSNSSNHDQEPARPSFTNAPLYPKNKRPVNLVSSWGGSSKSTVKPESSTAKYKQPLKKRRRLSTAVVKSLNSPARVNNNSSKLVKLTPRRHHQMGSIAGYKASGGTPKRLGTNTGEPRLAINMWKKKALKTEEERPKSAPATGSKFFRTVPKPFKLSTEVRAEERKMMDHRKKEEEQYKEQLRIREQERRRKENEKELLKYRSTLVHKAQPIKQYRRLEIKRSDKMLTLPESPHLSSVKPRTKLTSV